MRVYRLLYVLRHIKLLSPIAIMRLIVSIRKYGINLMALLHFSAKTYGSQEALHDGNETMTYQELLRQSELLAVLIKKKYQLSNGSKAAVMCRNHASLVKAIYAVSALGSDLHLLNADMGDAQLQQLIGSHRFDLIICDEEHRASVERTSYNNAVLLSYSDMKPAINNMLQSYGNYHDAAVGRAQRRASRSKLVLQTGGTTGVAKDAVHKPSLFHYLDPFYDFLHRLKILKYRTAYIATPIYHGYGVAVLLLFCALGKKAVLYPGFQAKEACRIIHEHKAEVVTVVPIMLRRMLDADAESLRSLSCIASGGAELSPQLVKETNSKLGNVLYNLYGTSEAGLTMIATPDDLKESPTTIGKPVKGVHLSIRSISREDCIGREEDKELEDGKVGRLCVRNQLSKRAKADQWFNTGDLAYRDKAGRYFLCGRADSMIVSGGENVYPLEVEQIILAHPYVEDAAVIGVPDEHYGQRLQAFIQLSPQADLTEEEIMQWLRGRIARYQMPKGICIVDRLPYTALGKLDRKSLSPNAPAADSLQTRRSEDFE